jgi:CheY-like chemotaxis protein
MPGMSGFELLSVIRRRFPQISTVAMSGAYVGDEVPFGVIADCFLAKGNRESASHWISRNGNNSKAMPR